MVADQGGQLRLIVRAHRRWVMWRVIERAGICASIASGVGMLVVLVLFWRAEPAVVPAVSLMAVGAVAGGIWGWSRRPTLLQTAILIDTQLGLHDLLSTSISPQRWGDADFGGVILQQARVRCESISANELVLRRLGSRQWGGIGIAAALVLTVGLMSGQATLTQASPELAARTGIPPAATSGSENPIRLVDSTTREGSQRAAAQAFASDDFADDRKSSSGRASAATENRSTPSADASGSAAGRTNDARVPALRQSGDSTAFDLSSNGDAPSSGGPASAMVGQGGAAGSGGSPPSGSAVTPWQSSTWESDIAQAARKIQSGGIPDAYRDLVRDYFSPVNP